MLGGTFDPIHLGHLAAARAAMECAHLDRVLFIPSSRPPHRAAAVAPAEHRLEMCRLAVDDKHGYEVSDIEIRRGGVSYTSDTLAELKRTHAEDEFFLILGWDAARLFSTWRKPQEILSLASIVVVARPGVAAPDKTQLDAAGFDPAKVALCLDHTPDISGSALRQAIAGGKPVSDKVPVAVAEFIAKNGLYRDNR